MQGAMVEALHTFALYEVQTLTFCQTIQHLEGQKGLLWLRQPAQGNFLVEAC